MDHDFWHAKWRDNEIAFHEAEANGLLRDHFHALALSPGDRIFLPLCGKTRDIAFLCAQGLHVVGAELSETAVSQLFADLDLVPEIRPAGPLTLYHAGPVSIFAGDVFALTQAALGPVAAVYDRAALVALPPEMRPRYATHLTSVTDAAPHLLISLDYDQTTMKGPPFSVPEAEIRALYGERFDIGHCETRPISGPLAARCSGSEIAWRLSPSAGA